MKAKAMKNNPQSWHAKVAAFFVSIFCVALFTSVALTNIAVLGLVLLAPFAWHEFYETNQSIEPRAKVLIGLLLVICGWDVLTNLLAGYGLGPSLGALLHDMRPLGFVVVLWAIFTNPYVARVAFWAMCLSILALASINLFLTLIGVVHKGEYFTTGFMRMSHLSHMYGQALVGLFFVLGQMWLVRPRLSWRVAIPMALLLLSLFLASERRTGYLILGAGFAMWGLLNTKRLLVGKGKWWFLLAFIGALCVAASSGVVERRMIETMNEFNEYMAMSPQQRVHVMGAVRIRMQFVSTIIEVIKDGNLWVGVGSIDLPSAYQAAAAKLGLEVDSYAWSKYNWSNPHNEYLFMWATKGIIGLVLYLAIFAQACRLGWQKSNEVQRIGLIMFVFLFMLSITTNSMLIDMEEGHFTMLILLVLLAPNALCLLGGNSDGESKKQMPI